MSPWEWMHYEIKDTRPDPSKNLNAMVTQEKAPYGTWKSPVTADVLTHASISFESVLVDDVTGEIYYVERRPSEGGRSVIVHSKDQKDLVDKNWSVRTSVHEYGGLAATASDGVVYFSNHGDNRVYRIESEMTPKPVTPENRNWRYAELTVVTTKPSIVLAVLEDHTNPEPVNVVNKLVAIDTTSQTVVTIVEGADFYSSLRISPNGRMLAWIQWHHPDMPWEGSELVLADVTSSDKSFKVENIKLISGQRGEVSVAQPQWVSDDLLLFLSDASGFMNPWCYSLVSLATGPIFSNPISEDFAEPAWTLGRSDFAVLGPQTAVFVSIRDGRSVLSLANLSSGLLKSLPSPYSVIMQMRLVSPHEVVILGRKDDESDAMVRVDLYNYEAPTYTVIKAVTSVSLPRDIISKAQAYALPLHHSNELVHVLYYPPFNPHFSPLPRETPPAVVSIHGGPTSRSLPGLDWAKQFWTSRGWAWLDVNHSGSSGYGRKYRERLKGNWGIVDVNDTVEAVQQLSKRGLIDPKRISIRGSSAGGFTVLATLANKPGIFSAGTSLYGISDLAKIAEDTHKFESRYADKLLGGTPQEVPDIYLARSPIKHANRIEAPLLILQGSIDRVVPPVQAETIVQSIKKKGGRVKYILFEGEGHGWRKAESIKRSTEAELAWYKDVFGLTRKPEAAL